MKKTIIGIVTIVTVLCMMLLATSVNAASISADNAKVSKGDIVTLTVKTDSQVESMQFNIKYDSSKFEYVANSAASDLGIVDSNAEGGVLIVSAFDTSKTSDYTTVQFKALENGDNLEFTISDTEFSKGGEVLSETVANPTLKVTVADQEEPSNPGDDTNTEEPSNPGDETNTENPSKPSNDNDKKDPTTNTEESNNNDGTYVDEDGNTITKLPQTGSMAPTIIFAVVACGVVALISYKAIKNRK